MQSRGVRHAEIDVSCVNADDELSLGVIGQIKLDLCAVVRVWRTEPGAISRPFIEPFAEIERAMANREEGFRRLNRQKIREHVPRFCGRASNCPSELKAPSIQAWTNVP